LAKKEDRSNATGNPSEGHWERGKEKIPLRGPTQEYGIGGKEKGVKKRGS